MTKSLTMFKESSNSKVDTDRWQLYVVLGILANAAIWASTLIFIKVQQPTYTSTLSATLPGAGASANVSLPNIGQASYQNSSPYANSSIEDPRETYKILATSEPVLKAVARQLNISPTSLGRPRIKIVQNTTIMNFEFRGASPEEARNKTLAFHQVFQAKLNGLRVQEAVQRDAGFQSSLNASETKLKIAQKRLSDYKARTGLNSSEQVTALSSNIETLRRQRAEILAQHQQASTRLKEISASLKISTQQAEDAFVLQTDQIFQQNLKDYSETSAALVVLSSKFLPNHPTVVGGKARRDAAQRALLTRSQSLLGRPINQAALQPLNPTSTNDSARDTVFQALVAARAQERGLQSQAQEINQQIIQLEGRLKKLAQQESTLEALQRDFRVAEAVFSSTLARLDIGRSNAFGSYPLIQTLIEPSLPIIPSSPKQEFVLLGATLGSLFLTTALGTLWLYRERKTTKNSSLENKRTEYPA